MSLEEKFNAAVNVIRSLPKSGSYQPSNELMLRFYSYYKQASEGPCDKPKPGFWDVVNRAKWESWSKLGNMTREEAMLAYVHELHKIVETMAYSENVAEFLSTGGGGDDEDERGGGFPTEDLELVAGDVLARVRSEHNSPIGSRSISPTGSPRAASPSAQAAAHAHAHRNRHDSDDEFIDTVDSEPEALPPPARAVQAAAAPPAACRDLPRLSNGHAHQITSQLTHLKVLEELPGTLARLERDVAALRKAVEGDRAMLNGSSRKWRWPWQELSPPTLLFVLLWPIVVTRLVSRRRRT